MDPMDRKRLMAMELADFDRYIASYYSVLPPRGSSLREYLEKTRAEVGHIAKSNVCMAVNTTTQEYLVGDDAIDACMMAWALVIPQEDVVVPETPASRWLRTDHIILLPSDAAVSRNHNHRYHVESRYSLIKDAVSPDEVQALRTRYDNRSDPSRAACQRRLLAEYQTAMQQ